MSGGSFHKANAHGTGKSKTLTLREFVFYPCQNLLIFQKILLYSQFQNRCIEVSGTSPQKVQTEVSQENPYSVKKVVGCDSQLKKLELKNPKFCFFRT